ncbi:MAG: xanthine dehydrogenase family protein subunit M [Chloroflexi bacterium]|nr:xanthine dehydrogenase family protein subunit M [Chloroflexota bacterium]
MGCSQHIDATSVTEAISILQSQGDKAVLVAGGTDLVGMLNNRLISPETLVNIKTIPGMDYIREYSGGLRIGALTRIRDIETSAIIREYFPVLAEAAVSVGSPQIRRMGTLGGNFCQEVRCWYYRRSPATGKTFTCYRKGGNVCYATSGDNRYHSVIGGKKCFAACPSDMAVALASLHAHATLAGASGTRSVPVEDFFIPLGNILKPGEMLTEVSIPALKPGSRQKFLKFRHRKTIDFALCSVASVLEVEAGVVADASLVLGGVAPFPYRAKAAEQVLKGQPLTEDLASEAGAAALRAARPLSLNAYKVTIGRVLVKRAILGVDM